MVEAKAMLKRTAYSLLGKSFVDLTLKAKRYINQQGLQNRIDKKNKLFIKGLLKSDKPIKLELGSPKRLGMEEWVSVDLSYDSDVQLDLLQPIPLPDNCVTEIYSSHLLEHFFYHELTQLLAECYRILKPKGTFKVAVPNAKIYLNAYLNNENFNYKEYCLYDTKLIYKSKIDYVNYMAYMGGHHRHMFDEESLLIVLADAGFKNVKLRDFDAALDLENRKYESIYAEVEK